MASKKKKTEKPQIEEKLFVADITLKLQPFKAIDVADVEKKLNAYIDRLAEVEDNKLVWPDATWTIYGTLEKQD